MSRRPRFHSLLAHAVQALLLPLGLLTTATVSLAASNPPPAPTAKPSGLTLHVSTAGQDTADGRSPARAFATLARARDEIRQLRTRGPLPAGGVTVEVQGGHYPLTESFALTADDSGTPQAPITYRAAPGQNVQLLGGRVLPLTAFKTVTDAAVVARLAPEARGKVVAASIAELGLTRAGPFPPRFSDSGGIFELFWAGRRLPLARWPNEGWTTIKEVLVNGDHKTPGVFVYRDDRPARWLQNPQLWLKGQWRVGWEDPALRVAKIDPTARTITLDVGLALGIGNKYTRPAGNGQEPWCAINLLEEIDLPGEWAIDFTTTTLYFWPPAARGELLVSQLGQPLVTVTGTAHLSFVGFTLEGSLGDGIVVKDGESVLIAGCTLRNLAKNGILLHGTRSGVQSCDLSQLGEGGILVSGGDKKSLTSSENFILNNHIHNYGVLKAMYSAGIDVGTGGQPNARALSDAVGVRVANNLLHDAPRDAILVSGQDHLFELNEVYRCGFGSADVGAFYSWFDWTIRGVVIRHNYLHDTVGGVNPDDGASGFHVYGNVFVGPRTGVWIASGPDHYIEHNIFVKDEGPVFGMDDRGIGRGYATQPRLIKGVEAIRPTEAPWATRFPEMKTLLADRPELPLRTRFVGNLIVMKTGDAVQLKLRKENKTDPRIFIQSDNLVTATDPGFVNAAQGDFTLRPDAPALKQIPGFKPIPFNQIGLQIDAYRRTLPTAAELRRPTPNSPNPSADKNFGT